MRSRGVLWLILVVVASGLLVANARAVTITVDTTDDVVAEDGFTSLREAIEQANSNGEPDLIVFATLAFPGTIYVTGSEMPVLTGDGTMIDGTSGGSLSPGDVVIDGSLLSAWASGLVLSASSLSIQGMKVTNFPGPGIYVGVPEGIPVTYDGISILDNIVEENGDIGIHVTGSHPGSAGGNSLTNMLIQGNTVSNHTDNAIFVRTTGGSGTPGGNTVSLDILNNTVSGVTGHSGIMVGGGDGGNGNTITATINGNTCTDTGGFGISVSAGWDSSSNNVVTINSIDGNTCTNARGEGISVTGGWDTSDNTVTVNSIAGNTCTGNGDSGIDVNLGSINHLVTVNSIEGNTCTGNGFSGIAVSGGNSNNTLTASITGNTCNNNGNHGVVLWGGDNWGGDNGNTITISSIDRNTATGNGDGGIHVNAGDSSNSLNIGQMNSNEARNNDGQGINVWGGDNHNVLEITSISDNDVSGNGGADWGAGIFVSAGGSDNTVNVGQMNSNDASNNGTSPNGEGIHVDSGDQGGTGNEVWLGRINSNTVLAVGATGIFVSGGANGNANSTLNVDEIDGNTCIGGAGGFGIYVEGGNNSSDNAVTINSIDGNVCSSNFWAGITVAGGIASTNNSVTVGSIRNNALSSNGSDGSSIWGGLGFPGNPASGHTVTVGSIEGNAATGNSTRIGPNYGCGIFVGGGLDNTLNCAVTVNSLSGNTLTDNAGNGIAVEGVFAGPWPPWPDWSGDSHGNVCTIKLIQGNDVARNENIGIGVLGTHDPTGSSDLNRAIAVVEGNTVANNTVNGVFLSDYSYYPDEPSPNMGNFVYADLGGGDGALVGGLGSAGGNLITGNGESPADIVNNIAVEVFPNVLALNNTFDHTDPADIDDYDVFDDDEDPTYGPVLFEGYVFRDLSLQEARADVNLGELYLHGRFQPSPKGDRIDLTSKDVTVAVFNAEGFVLSGTIPAELIRHKGRIHMFADGVLGGITRAEFIGGRGKGPFTFTLWAEGVDLTKWSEPVMLRLVIGNNVGEASLWE